MRPTLNRYIIGMHGDAYGVWWGGCNRSASPFMILRARASPTPPARPGSASTAPRRRCRRSPCPPSCALHLPGVAPIATLQHRHGALHTRFSNFRTRFGGSCSDTIGGRPHAARTPCACGCSWNHRLNALPPRPSVSPPPASAAPGSDCARCRRRARRMRKARTTFRPRRRACRHGGYRGA
jgi:hypothetical protein